MYAASKGFWSHSITNETREPYSGLYIYIYTHMYRAFKVFRGWGCWLFDL